MFKIIVLVSGSGTNMLQLIKNNIKIDCIIADRECKAKNIADEYKIDFVLLNRDKEISKNLLKIFEKRKPGLIVLAGFLSILDGEILEKYKNKIINIHPSLLPKYGGNGMYGLKVHQAVFENGDKESGCTVHYVTSNVDAGEIIAQDKVDISMAKSPEEIQKIVLEREWKLLPRVVKELIKKADIIIHAGDPDDEGQYLVDEIFEYLNCKKPVKRLLINDNSLEAVKKAFNKMEDNRKFISLGEAAKARSIADIILGINLSRFFTLTNKDKTTLTVGRVQTPTLALVVNRDFEIENHIKEKYFENSLDLTFFPLASLIIPITAFLNSPSTLSQVGFCLKISFKTNF